jgi:hypothetical protein
MPPDRSRFARARTGNKGRRTTGVFDWLFEGLTTVYVLLAAALLGCLFVYWQYRRNAWLYAAAVVAALIGVYWLLDRLVKTEREQIQEKVEVMAQGLRDHNLDAVFEHLSDDFLSPQGRDKAALRKLANDHINGVTQVTVWDLRWDSKPEPGKEYDGLVFSFKVRGVGADDFHFDCRPLFAYEPGRGWRVKRLKILKPGTTEELPAPF